MRLIHLKPSCFVTAAISVKESIEAFGSYQRLDDATAALTDVLRNNPEIYPVVECTVDVRLCLTDYSGDVPAARWWLRIVGNRIELLWVEKVEDRDGDG